MRNDRILSAALFTSLGAASILVCIGCAVLVPTPRHVPLESRTSVLSGKFLLLTLIDGSLNSFDKIEVALARHLKAWPVMPRIYLRISFLNS